MKRSAVLAVLVAACGTSSSRPPARDAGNQVTKPAHGSPVELAIATHGTELELTLKNASSASLKVATRVESGRIDFDWLVVELTDAAGATRALRFVSDRDESARIVADLAPGAIDVERLDLAEWAIRPGNGAALAPGTYQVRAIWDSMRETDVAMFLVEATTTMTVPAPVETDCDEKGYQAPAGAKLQLLAHQLGGGAAIVEVGLHNAGTEAVCVWSRIATHEDQSDWLQIHYSDGAKYHHFSRVIELDDARDKSAPVAVLLEPGATAWTTWDVAAWALRDRNGKEALPSGSLWANAVYDTSKDTWAWAGTLRAQFELRVP